MFYIEAIKNLNNKRVGDLSANRRVFVIKNKNCITKIFSNPDYTLKIVQEKISSLDYHDIN